MIEPEYLSFACTWSKLGHALYELHRRDPDRITWMEMRARKMTEAALKALATKGGSENV